MLAFKTGLPTAYDPILTLASLLIAIGVTSLGFLIAVQGDGKWQPVLGGVVIGAGIGSMHYAGMRAFTTTGTVTWDDTLVAASIVLGVVFAAAALVRFHSGFRRWAAVGAAGLLTIAIFTLHFTAMGAAIITPDPTIVVYPSFMDNSMMALAVAGVASLVIFAALAAALIDRESARESAVRLYELADAAAEGIVVAKGRGDHQRQSAHRRAYEAARGVIAGKEGVRRSALCAAPSGLQLGRASDRDADDDGFGRKRSGRSRLEALQVRCSRKRGLMPFATFRSGAGPKRSSGSSRNMIR
jgi:NO-binding membrane sensor protein with MHYT domain